MTKKKFVPYNNNYNRDRKLQEINKVKYVCNYLNKKGLFYFEETIPNTRKTLAKKFFLKWHRKRTKKHAKPSMPET